MPLPAAVLFDFDGVIVDSLSFHLEAWDYVCHTYLDFHMSDEIKHRIIGKSTRAIAEDLVRESGREADVAFIVKAKNTWLQQHYHHIKLLPGVRAMLRRLQEENIPHGIASNASKIFLEKVIENHALPFPIVLGLEDYQKPKPAPEPYLKLAKLLNVPFLRHPQVVVFEDSAHGLRAAKDAGMYPIGVKTQHPESELEAAGARHTVAHLEEFVDGGLLHTVIADETR